MRRSDSPATMEALARFLDALVADGLRVKPPRPSGDKWVVEARSSVRDVSPARVRRLLLDAIPHVQIFECAPVFPTWRQERGVRVTLLVVEHLTQPAPAPRSAAAHGGPLESSAVDSRS